MMSSCGSLTKRKMSLGIGSCLVVALLLLVIDTGSCATGPAVIKISDRATVDEKLIRLDGISQIIHDDPHRRTLLKEVVLGNSPLPGRSKTLDSSFIVMRLKQHGVDLSRIRLEMPAPVTIVRGFQRVSIRQIKDAVSQFLAGWRSVQTEDLRIGDIHVSKEVVVSRGTLKLSVAALKDGSPSGKLPLSVAIMVNAKVERKLFATVDVDVMCQAVFTRKALGRNHVICETDVELREVQRSRLPKNYIDDISDILGKKTKRKILASTSLRSDLVEFPFLIRRQDVVVIMASMQGMQVTTLGEAKQKGRRGDRIRVVNLDSQKSVYARVVDGNTVAVDF